jgi:hypothetical protein
VRRCVEQIDEADVGLWGAHVEQQESAEVRHALHIPEARALTSDGKEESTKVAVQ